MITLAHPPFKIAQHRSQTHGNQQINRRRDNIGRQDIPCPGTDKACHFRQIIHRDHADHGGFLYQNDKFISQGGKNIFDGLGKDDIAHRLNMGKAQGTAGLCLSFGHRFDACADNLRYISPGIDPETDGSDDNLVAVPGRKNQIINYHNLHDQRRSSDHRGIKVTESRQRLHNRIFAVLRADLYHRHQNADEHAQKNSEQRHHQRDLDAADICQIAFFRNQRVVKACI